MKTITFTLEKDGTVKVETSGFQGASCVKETESFERALGLDPKREYKPEFYQTQTVTKTAVKR